MPLAQIPPEWLRPLRVDLGDDVYTLMRRELGASYEEALPPPGGVSSCACAGDPPEVPEAPQPSRTIFMPGCSLASCAPALTNAVYKHLRNTAGASGISVRCCGVILADAAGKREQDAYQQQLCASIRESGAGRLVIACPNCCRAFAQLAAAGLLPGIELVALPVLLAEQGMRIKPGAEPSYASACVHDSCPDRSAGVFAKAVRELLADVETREMQHNRRSSRCCGAGKLLPMRAPELSQRLRNERIAEYAETGADILVTPCVNCTQSFADYQAYHYLELLFETPIDWPQAQAAQEAAQAAYFG